MPESRVALVRFQPGDEADRFSILLESEVNAGNWRLLECETMSVDGELGTPEQIMGWLAYRFAKRVPLPRVVLTPNPNSYVVYRSAEFFSE